MSSIIYAKDLSVYYHDTAAVDRASFEIQSGEILALVGGSGSGKTTLGLALARLTDFLPCRVTGSLLFKERPVLSLNEEEIRNIRRHEIAYVFQDPSAAFNPLLKVGFQIAESLPDKGRNRRKILDLLEAAHLDDPERVSSSYPHELSGGMKQRAMIAMAMAKDPSLAVLDEPTSALDATVQKGILKLILEWKKKGGTSFLFITHDLGVARAVADRIFVMHKGAIVDRFSDPRALKPGHPYSERLLRCAEIGTLPKSRIEI